MANTRVTTKKVTLQAEAIKRAVARDPAVLKKLEDEFRKYTGRQMVNVVTEHYQEAINQAARVVDQGIPGAESDTTPTISTRFGGVTLGLWAALAPRYRKFKARSAPGTQGLFWKLSGATGKYMIRLAVGVKSARLSRVKAVPSSATAKATVRVSATITTPVTGDPVIDGLMRDPFVQGEVKLPTKVRGADGKSLTPAGIVAVTEARRPLISQLAATLGKRAQQALRKIKQ